MNDSPTFADLVPHPRHTLRWIMPGGVAVISLLGMLYFGGQHLAHWTTDGGIAAFDLDSEGSIASWFSVVLLFLCGLVCVVLSRFRRAAGKGREARLWLAAAAVWCMMSLDEGASLHEAYKELVARAAGTRLLGDGSIYWAVPYALLLFLTGGFILHAVRHTISAVVCLFVAGACYGLAALGQLDIILAGRPSLETWFEETCEMLADLCILSCLLLHAFHSSRSLDRRGQGGVPGMS